MHHREAALQHVFVGHALEHPRQGRERARGVAQGRRLVQQRRQARRRRRQALAGEAQLLARMRQRRRQLRDPAAAPGHQVCHRVHQALGAVVEALADLLEQAPGVGQAAPQALDPHAPLRHQALAGRGHAPLRLLNLVEQLAAHRHRELGGGGRRRRAQIGGEIDQRGVGLVADAGDQRDLGFGGGADHDFLVERPKVLQAAAAAGDDQQVRPRRQSRFGSRLGSRRGQAIEAADRGRDLLGGGLALDQDRPDQDVAREPIGEAVQDVADHRAGGRGDHADDLGQIGQRPLAFLGEQALGGELALALLQQLEQRALAGQLQPLDHDLIAGAAGIGGDPAARDHLHAVLRGDAEPPGGAAPADRVEHRARVLEREIEVAGGGALEARDLAAHADELEAALERSLDRLGHLGDREDRQVGAAGPGTGAGLSVTGIVFGLGKIAHGRATMLQDARVRSQGPGPDQASRAR